MVIPLYQINNIKNCPFKAFMSQNNFKKIRNKQGMINSVYRAIISHEKFLKLTKDEVLLIITRELDSRQFLTKQEEKVESDIILTYILRYLEYERTKNRGIIARNIKESVKIGDNDIEVSVDIIFEDIDAIEVVKYKSSKTKLSYKARTENNKPHNNIELFAMGKLGEKLYPNTNKSIIASTYYLKNKSEDKKTLNKFIENPSDIKLSYNANKYKLQQSIDEKCKSSIKQYKKALKAIGDTVFFEHARGNNIISISSDEGEHLTKEIDKILKTELSYESTKCESDDCNFCDYSTLCKYKPVINELEGIDPNEHALGVHINKTGAHINKTDALVGKTGAHEIKFTKSQQEVISVNEGIFRINGIPGCGKTFTIARRTVKLIQEGYSPYDILMITFTKKGTSELRDKIKYWLDYYELSNISIENMNIFTFNSFGEDIISKEWYKTEIFTAKPTLATAIDTNDIIKDLLHNHENIEWLDYKNPLMNFPNAQGAFITLNKYFNLIKSFGYNHNSFITNVILKEKASATMSIVEINNKSKKVFQLYLEFNNALKGKNLLQYQDQVLYLIELFKNNDYLIKKYGYQHIVVDEYQDTDFAQVELLKLMLTFERFKSLIAIGDSSQSIFSFKNTTVENIINFHKVFGNVKDIYLLENFRSTPEICYVANQLDKINTNRINKEMVSTKSSGSDVVVINSVSLSEEYKAITSIIKDKIFNQNYKPQDICFISRTRKELLELKPFLDDAGIPNIIEVGELYLDNIGVKHIINMAKYMLNKNEGDKKNDYYLAEHFYIETELLKIRTKDYIVQEDFDIKDTVESLRKTIIKYDETMDSLTNKIGIIDDKMKESLNIEMFLDLIQPLIDNDPTIKSFIEDLNPKGFKTYNELLIHLSKLELYQDNKMAERNNIKYKAVSLTTAHSSKGKEWKVVFNSINKYKHPEEEERRLLFVSITRAEDELYITYNTNQDKSRNKGVYNLFADEINNILKEGGFIV